MSQGCETPEQYALMGAAGFVAPRHLRAIRDNGGQLVAAFDPKDSVGVLDQYFPEASFFVEFERFDRHIDKMRRRGQVLDYVSICSPNYLHDSHARFALRSGADAICEKPLVINPWNLDGLLQMEKETARRVYTILQLRLHPTLIALKQKIEKEASSKKHDIDLTYITSRGKWYLVSWKGDEAKSGGVAANIGVHFFDMLSWIFGDRQGVRVHEKTPTRMAGFLEYEKARVRWLLSVESSDLPAEIQKKKKKTYRSLKIDGQELEFSEGFQDLHSQAYTRILSGSGFGILDAQPSIETVHQIREATVLGKTGEYHPYLKEISHG